MGKLEVGIGSSHAELVEVFIECFAVKGGKVEGDWG